ncbi:hypothetical protein [Rhizobium sp. 12,4]|uniref:hypothetical protein n=1 Tax=Rhizobium sp. 12,4 TaxID=3405135 RepID=UPI003D356718
MSHGRFKLRYQTKANAFDGAAPDSRWALGLMAADGNVRSAAAQVRFGQGAKNKDILDAMKAHIGHEGEPSYQASTNSYMMSWTSGRHVDDLAVYGVVDAKSLSFALPEIDLMSFDFLRGYIDGDGCVGYYSNGTHRKYLHVSWVGTAEFINQCQDWLPIQGKTRSLGNVTEIRFSGTKAVELCGLIYSAQGFKSRKQSIYESSLAEVA